MHIAAPGSILLVDSILRRENDLSLVQVFRQEKSLAVRMCELEASNADQSEEVCHQGWCLH